MSWRTRLRVVLIEPRNALNIGAAARAMLNFGFDELWLVDPWDEAFRNAKSAMGAREVLARARVVSDRSEALGEASLIVGTSAARGRATDLVQRELPVAGGILRTHLDERPAALVFGSEKFGLSRRDLSYCDWLLTIPTDPDCPSMNLGQAVAVCCYELSRRSEPIPERQPPAGLEAAERDRIVELLLDALGRSGFLFSDSVGSQTRKIRRFVARLRLAPKDARMFQGMLRQILWRFDHPEEAPWSDPHNH